MPVHRRHSPVLCKSLTDLRFLRQQIIYDVIPQTDTSLLWWAVCESKYEDNSNGVWMLAIWTCPNSQMLPSWNVIDYLYKLLFYPSCQGNAWISKQGSLQIWVVKGIMWQLQIAVEIENKTSQLLITCCLTSFCQNARRKESGCDFLFSCPLLYSMYFHVCRDYLEILTVWQTKHFFLTIIAPLQGYCSVVLHEMERLYFCSSVG